MSEFDLRRRKIRLVFFFLRGITSRLCLRAKRTWPKRSGPKKKKAWFQLTKILCPFFSQMSGPYFRCHPTVAGGFVFNRVAGLAISFLLSNLCK